MSRLEIQEPSILIRIARLYDPRMTQVELWDATRGVWRIGPDRDRAKYAFAVAGGIVMEVYEIAAWNPAGTGNYCTRPLEEVDIPGRWEFTGRKAPESLREKYIGKSVADYFKKGNQNPIMYVNIKRREKR